MPNYTEKDLQDAIDDVLLGFSLRQASRRRGVPRSTLSKRITGTPTRQSAHEYRQKLSKAQEENLAGWILTQQDLGFPPTHSQVGEFASRLARRNGFEGDIGNHWIDTYGFKRSLFLRRNLKLKAIRDFLLLMATDVIRLMILCLNAMKMASTDKGFA